MRTTLALDDELLQAAQEYTGITEKSALVREALKALVQREKQPQARGAGGDDAWSASCSAPGERVILADTSIWVDHLRYNNRQLGELLANGAVVCHPYVVAELALGSLRDRLQVLALLDHLPQVRVSIEEVRAMIEARALHAPGIGLIDAHLLASVLIDATAQLWTADKRLRQMATEMGVHVDFAESSIH